MSGRTRRTRLAHAGSGEGPGVVPPIELSTTFPRGTDYALAGPDIYRRDQNATVRAAEAALADVEGAADARLFASGMAAIAALFRAADGPILVQDSAYYGTGKLIERLAARQTITTFPIGDLSALSAACEAHRPALVFIETPANPLITVTAIDEAAAIAHSVGAILGVDGTAATPMVTRPLEHGADIVAHSATKGLNGHSDVLAGVLATGAPSALWDRVLEARAVEGAVLSPFDASLLLRGMRTLALRIAAMNESALHIADWLAAHPRVLRVRYPGLPSDPGHDVARRQMEGFGGLLAFEVENAAAALRVAGRLSLITRATSLGGTETLIEHRHSIEPSWTGVPEGLLRLSVGIESVGDLVADLAEGLAALD
ncbi:MAG: PLP-dependent aspartate aminotransferase family protein [Pseudomonadota bacterium]